MKELIVAKRYAEAFIGYTRNTIGITGAAEELKSLKIIVSKNPNFLSFLSNLEVIYDDKCAFIDKVLNDFSDETRTFLKLLLKKGRIKNIIDVADYIRVNYYHGESIDALLKTSYPLDSALVRRIKERLEHRFKRRLNLHIELDADLLGGVQATVGNKIIDGSVRRRLDELKDTLKRVRV